MVIEYVVSKSIVISHKGKKEFYFAGSWNNKKSNIVRYIISDSIDKIANKIVEDYKKKFPELNENLIIYNGGKPENQENIEYIIKSGSLINSSLDQKLEPQEYRFMFFEVHEILSKI
jgi:hypothetical protein